MTPSEKTALEGYFEFTLNTILEETEKHVDADFTAQLWKIGEDAVIDLERTLQARVEICDAERRKTLDEKINSNDVKNRLTKQAWARAQKKQKKDDDA